MLRKLNIRSFALIDEIELDFPEGMTVFLGETGAGKSIIIDALAAALGERATSDAVRQGARKAVVEASFVASRNSRVDEILAENELHWDSPDLVLRRELSPSGGSRSFVNDTPAPLAVLKELATHLIDFHGQHDTTGLMSTQRHRDLLDDFAGAQAEVQEMRERWLEYAAARTSHATLLDRARTSDADRVRLEFLVNEIASVDPYPGEDLAIDSDLLRAEAREKILTLANTSREALYNAETNAYGLLRDAISSLRELSAFHTELTPAIEDLEAAAVSAKEAALTLSSLAEADDFSTEDLERLRMRKVDINRLMRKYGSLDEALRFHESLKEELAQLENLAENLEDSERALLQCERLARRAADTLRKTRQAAKERFSKSVESTVSELGMPSAQFVIDISETDLGVKGADKIEFLFSANAGVTPKPLAKVASGGELSRLMLAMKTALASTGFAGTMVFDEIDTGISGRVARTVGTVMMGLAQTHQILCITHLAQIASLAGTLVRVEKTEQNGRTEVSAAVLASDEAQREIAKLLSGADVTPATLESARELMVEALGHSAQKRKKG